MSFPQSPTFGQQHVEDNRIYEWDGAVWILVGKVQPTGSGKQLPTGEFFSAWLPSSTDFPDDPDVGDTFTNGVHTWEWDGVSWVYHPAGVVEWEEVDGKPDFDTVFVPRTGGTMTGQLTLVGGPIDPNHPANKQYVDDYKAVAENTYFKLTGGFMFGDLHFTGDDRGIQLSNNSGNFAELTMSPDGNVRISIEDGKTFYYGGATPPSVAPFADSLMSRRMTDDRYMRYLGAWVPGTVAKVQELWSYNNNVWLCTAATTTTDEPSEASPNWLLFTGGGGTPSIPTLTFPPLVNQTFIKNTGVKSYTFSPAFGTGLIPTYSLENTPIGVSLVSETRVIFFDTDTLPEAENVSFTVRATDQYNQTTSQSAMFSIVVPTFAYSEAVTSTDETFDNTIRKTVTVPAHIAAYDAGVGAGIYDFDIGDAFIDPTMLYPGEYAISSVNPGGDISITQEAWFVGIGTVDVTYRLMTGATLVAALVPGVPYTTTEVAGTIFTIIADGTDDNGTTSVEVATFTLEEPVGTPPNLTDFSFNYDDDLIGYAVDIPCNLTWRRFPLNHVFGNRKVEVHQGIGAYDGGTIAVEAGQNDDPITFTGGPSGLQGLFIVAQDGSGPLSEVIGGTVDIIVTDGLTAPNIISTSKGGTPTAVSSVTIPLGVCNEGDLVELPILINCPASDIAGVEAVGPNGEVATVAQAPVDNEAGASSISMALLYYFATATTVTGNITVSITPGGVKSIEQIACTPIVRENVRDTGNPYGQIIKTFSAAFVASIATAEVTAISTASRIEACIGNAGTLPPGTAPAGWFMRERELYGPQAIQTMSKNDETVVASQVIAPATVPLGQAQPCLCLVWELLPLGY